MNQNLVFTLGFNLVSEIRQAVERLYKQNDKKEFTHLLVDCGFPLLNGDEIPENIAEAKAINSWELQKLANECGSDYLKIKNEGVSQNWSSVYNHFKPEDSDVMITCEPDEIQHEDGWVASLGEVLQMDKSMGYASPTLVDHIERLRTSRYAHLKKIGKYNVYIMSGGINYGQVAISGRLLNKMRGVPVPSITPIYGNIESVLSAQSKKYNMTFGVLKDYTQTHTNVPILYRKYKDEIIFNIDARGQYSFEKWLNMKINGEL